MAGAKNANLEGFERIAAALRREGYVVLLCVAPEDPDTRSPPRIAGAVTFRGTPEAPVDVSFRTVEQMALDAGILGRHGKA